MVNLLSVLAECAGKPHAAIETTKEDVKIDMPGRKSSLLCRHDAAWPPLDPQFQLPTGI
jgi:hypothetical protein